jgi:hypothetical protein
VLIPMTGPDISCLSLRGAKLLPGNRSQSSGVT